MKKYFLIFINSQKEFYKTLFRDKFVGYVFLFCFILMFISIVSFAYKKNFSEGLPITFLYILIYRSVMLSTKKQKN